MGAGTRRPARWGWLAAAMLLASGCAAFKLDNPFLPAAHLLVTANPAIVTSSVRYSVAQDKFLYEDQSITFDVKTFPNDITPGVVFTDYEVSFFDNRGAAINNFLLPKQRMGATMYIPRGGGGTTGAAAAANSVTLPVVSQQVVRYAIENGFVNVGTSEAPVIRQNPNPWSQDITGEALLYGIDENQHAALASCSFTVHFRTDIQ